MFYKKKLVEERIKLKHENDNLKKLIEIINVDFEKQLKDKDYQLEYLANIIAIMKIDKKKEKDNLNASVKKYSELFIKLDYILHV